MNLQIAHTNERELRGLPRTTPPLTAVPQDRAAILENAKAYITTLPHGGPPKDHNVYVSDYAHEIIF